MLPIIVIRPTSTKPGDEVAVSLVYDTGLEDRVIEVRSPAEAKNFSSSLIVQTGSGDHPASYAMGTG
jgi:hypothetical protein